MAQVTNITYDTADTLTITSFDSLAADGWCVSTQVDNTSDLFVDFLVGGLAVTSATPVAGDTVDIYAVAVYSDTATDVGGAVDTTGAIGATAEVLTIETEFISENLRFLMSISTDKTSAEQYHWGPVSVASAFSGVLPKKWAIVMHNNTSETSGTGNTLKGYGITYTHT